MNLRVGAIGRMFKPALRRLREESGGRDVALKSERAVYFADAGMTVLAPAVIEEMDPTTVIHPGCISAMDGFEDLLLSEGESREQGVESLASEPPPRIVQV